MTFGLWSQQTKGKHRRKQLGKPRGNDLWMQEGNNRDTGGNNRAG